MDENSILYCDNHILVAVKPCNVPSQADASGDEDMLTRLKKEHWHKIQQTGQRISWAGAPAETARRRRYVIFFARTSKAAARLSAQFAAHAQGRRYLAVTRGQ